MRHKLVPFILKNPPKTKKGRKGSKNQDETANANAEENAEDNPVADADGGDSDDELTRRIKAEAAELQDKGQLADGDWSVDTSAEAVKARVKALEGGLKTALTLGDDESEDGGDDPYGVLGHWIQENRSTITPVSVYKKAEELGIEKKHKSCQILVQALLGKDMVADIAKFAPLFKKVRTRTLEYRISYLQPRSPARRNTRKPSLVESNGLFGIDHPELVPSVPKILAEFYKHDILDEEVIKQWGTHVSKKYVDRDTSKRVRKASEPFLKVRINRYFE